MCGHKASLKIITKKPVVATEDEISMNRRAAPSKLRVAEKI
jgi:16S rRNA (cytosine1402-N4)-methyltransferase